MNIFFDLVQKRWSHRRAGRHFVWGKRQTKLPRLPFSPSLHYKVRKNNKRIGPLVGILTSPGQAGFSGNRKTFRRIHKVLQNRGGLSFVFTPRGVKANRMKGYIYNEQDRLWISSDFPYPDVVYNRIPTREDERNPAVHTCFERLSANHIPFFNQGFLDKWEMYQCLIADPRIATFLPKTRLLTKEELKIDLTEWPTIYLKPRAGQKGDGIRTVSMDATGRVSVRSFKRYNDFPSFAHMWEGLRQNFEKADYLIQPKILLNNHDGRPYDFRLILQKEQGEWCLTGAGVRLAGENAVTTHVPKGGKLMALADIHPPVDLSLITELCIDAAHLLETQFPPLDELSFDIGRDIYNCYWLFEANAKPMAFDEPEIEATRMERLIDLFYEKSGFGHKKPSHAK